MKAQKDQDIKQETFSSENQSNRRRELKSIVLNEKSQDDKDSNQPDENELTNLGQKTIEIQGELVDEIINTYDDVQPNCKNEFAGINYAGNII